jgi:hypothetical protein
MRAPKIRTNRSRPEHGPQYGVTGGPARDNRSLFGKKGHRPEDDAEALSARTRYRRCDHECEHRHECLQCSDARGSVGVLLLAEVSGRVEGFSRPGRRLGRRRQDGPVCGSSGRATASGGETASSPAIKAQARAAGESRLALTLGRTPKPALVESCWLWHSRDSDSIMDGSTGDTEKHKGCS